MSQDHDRSVPRFGEADLTNCDLEPIHIPGSIQPHGAMLVYDTTQQVVTHASANAAEFLGVRDIVGNPLEGVIGIRPAHSVRNAVAKSVAASAPGLLFAQRIDGSDRRFDVAAHSYLGRTFIEFELSQEGADGYGPLELTRAMSRRLADEKSLPNLTRSAARMVSLMLGYDRVMVYKMLHNGAGRVIAEQKRPDLGTFLGQHFPASDIPAQARELYKRNWIRMISDARYTPQPVLPPIPQSETPLDMSYAQLRSVSPVHCEYLQNMGVDASMSISIMVEGELWGMIACHHYSPKIVPLPQRVGIELFGQLLSLQIETLERRERFDISNRARQRLDRIVAELAPEAELHESLSPRLADIAQLLPCDGAALWINNAWLAHGATPPEESLKPLLAVLAQQTAGGTIWSTNQLVTFAPQLEGDVFNVAGILAVPMSKSARDYLMFFRSEESRTVEWGGDPTKAKGPLGDRLTPRKSFDLWREEVRGQSTPWVDSDIAIAEAAQNYLRDVVLRHSEATSDERKRTEVRRKLVNEELNHRVKNILALTKSIVEQSRASATGVKDYANAVAGRLQALSFAHDQITRESAGGDLRRLIESEVAAYGGVSGERSIVRGPAVQLNSRAYSSLALVIHELATNAAKYGALSNASGVVEIVWTVSPQGDCIITWEERGGPLIETQGRAGFGSTLIERVVPFDLGGKAEVAYLREGAKARLAIPARHVLEGKTAGEAAHADAAPASASDHAKLTGMRVLLVEDQVLIALDAESCLKALGAAQVVIAPTSEHALNQIKNARPDLAVLDVNLGDHTSTPVAELLRTLGVPFVFATGYGDTVMIPESLRGTPMVRKPYADTTLAQAITTLLRDKDRPGET